MIRYFLAPDEPRNRNLACSIAVLLERSVMATRSLCTHKTRHAARTRITTVRNATINYLFFFFPPITVRGFLRETRVLDIIIPRRLFRKRPTAYREHIRRRTRPRPCRRPDVRHDLFILLRKISYEKSQYIHTRITESQCSECGKSKSLVHSHTHTRRQQNNNV